jgi:hypothetical protein
MMTEKEDLQTFQNRVLEELRLLQGRLPEWRQAGPYTDHLRPLDPLERREAARLDRLLRQERAAGGERERERELLEQREQTLLQREQDLTRLRAQLDSWLADIQQLEPDSRDWCAEQSRLSTDMGVTPALLDQTHQWRRQAAERLAISLMARPDVRAAIAAAMDAVGRDPIALTRAVTPLLAALDPAAGGLQQPVVIAALALLSLRAKG